MPITRLVQLPCHRCGSYATTLELRELPRELAALVPAVVAMLRIRAAATGAQIPELALDCHPLAAFPPETIAELFGVTHPACVAGGTAPQRDLQLHVVG